MCMQFRTFWKKDEYRSLIFSGNYGLRKEVLLKRLKGRASEDHAVINVLTGSKHMLKSTRAPLLSYFSMHLGYIELEKSALVWSEILNTVC